MSWKNLPSWLKGGAIGTGSGIILDSLFFIIRSFGFDMDSTILSVFTIFLVLVGFPWSFIIFSIGYGGIEGLLGGGFLGVIINGFIIGAYYGWLKLWKAKRRKRQDEI